MDGDNIEDEVCSAVAGEEVGEMLDGDIVKGEGVRLIAEGDIVVRVGDDEGEFEVNNIGGRIWP